jgi:hypothetical protein
VARGSEALRGARVQRVDLDLVTPRMDLQEELAARLDARGQLRFEGIRQ